MADNTNKKSCLLHCLFCGFGEENNSKCQQMHSFIIFAYNLYVAPR